jgi:hypothetical protein
MASYPEVRSDHHHANSFRTAPSLCADMIFGKYRRDSWWRNSIRTSGRINRLRDELAARYFDRLKKARFWDRFQFGEVFDLNAIFEEFAGGRPNPSRSVKKNPKRKS